MVKRNIYNHKIDLKNLKIQNTTRSEFTKFLEDISYLGYKVEDISDGTKVVICKPGGKSVYGRLKRDDFFVFLYNPKESALWQISHKQIREDLEEKSRTDLKGTVHILQGLERVFEGEDPDVIIKEDIYQKSNGLLPEAIFKLYKWIWGQEDVNYPDGLGREMSWFGKEIEDGEVILTGEGLKDFMNNLEKNL